MEYDWNGTKLFESLVGKTIVDFKVSDDKGRIDLRTSDGIAYSQYHSQDCCETVVVESVVGDISDILGSPILRAEVAESPDDPPGVTHEYAPESQTWTFYKLATIKGSVDIRWHGESNGYYSESVTFAQTNNAPV